ncbi:hypothetical protein ACIRJL_10675 [Streptomyces sp. NPDC102383]|uniref:hypothetical protein n=1 Tax=Streptomyces sp. NPDC102383 TaxID=3366165 RepID=UPI003815D01E
MQLIYHPAGPDELLRGALSDLQTGRWLSTRDLLERTGQDWALRTSRSQALAVSAATSGVIEAWLHEDPGHPDAQVMRARVAVERALRAHRQQHALTVQLEQEAREAAWSAARGVPEDPVPWVCLVALAQLDERRSRPEHRVKPLEMMLPRGPWGLVDEVNQRDTSGNREAFHRLLQVLLAQSASLGTVLDFGQWVASWASTGSPLLVLPLYAQAEQMRRNFRPHGDDPLWRHTWSREPIKMHALRAFEYWFRVTDPRRRSITDLSHLAFALWAGHQQVEAAAVFTAMGPFASRTPWSFLRVSPAAEGTGEALFWRARRESLGFERRAQADSSTGSRPTAERWIGMPLTE